MKNSALQYITQSNKIENLEEEMRRVLDYGVEWIQLRVKNYEELSEDQFYGFYEKCGELTYKLQEGFECTFIINDNVRLCQHLSADGVHLGKKDLDLQKARDLLPNKIIGATANELKDIENAQSKGADYIGLGPLRETTTKKNIDGILGFNGFQEVFKNTIDIPVVAIGGVLESDCQKLKKIGLHGIAVSGLLFNHGSQELVKRINSIFNP